MASKTWFYGKNVLLTGASSGIGFYIANLLVSKYACHVVGVGRNIQKLENAKKAIEENVIKIKESKRKRDIEFGSFRYMSLDISLYEHWEKLKRELDESDFKLDILINNAGIILPFLIFKSSMKTLYEYRCAKKFVSKTFFASSIV